MRAIKPSLFAISLSILPFCTPLNATSVDDFIAISAYLGGRYSDDLTDSETGQRVDVSNNFSQALALSWYYGHNSEGELLYSSAKQAFNMHGEQKTLATDLYLSYLHFGGRINFITSPRFSSSLGLGIGATFFLPDSHQYDNEIALSGNITGGIRYQLSSNWAVKADLRFYGTVLNNNSTLICSNNECLIELAGEIYVQTELMAGFEYKF